MALLETLGLSALYKVQIAAIAGVSQAAHSPIIWAISELQGL
jgi:hypothetical protein